MPKMRNEIGISPMLRAAQQAPLLSAEEEKKLAGRAQAGDESAFNRLLGAHFRLVLAIAHELRSYGLPMDELVAEGMLGLVEAARRFDPERGVRLAVYAAWWIRAYMRRYTLSNRRIVRPPSTRHGRKLLANLRKTQRELEARSGERADAIAVAEVLGVSVEEVEEMEAALSGRDVPCGPTDAETRHHEPSDAGPSPELLVAEQETQEKKHAALREALEGLSDRERKIMQLRFMGSEVTSLASIGRDMGLSRERVRQLAQQAEQKLRQSMVAHVA